MKRVIFAVLISVLPQDSFCEDIYFINANESIYENDDVYCNGNVIVTYCGKILSADHLSYNKNTKTIFASGNIIIKDEAKNIYLADFIKIEQDFLSGCGSNLKIIMPDKSRLAAKKIVLKNKKFELFDVVYTPCYECALNNELTWKIKSKHVVFDPSDSTLYDDATFDLFGRNILYLPHLSQPSPQVKSKTGFLMPKISISSKNGFNVMPRYFVNMSDYQSLILKPTLSTKVGVIGGIYYATRFRNGEFDIDASITGVQSVNDYNTKNLNSEDKKIIDNIKKSGYRGHIFSKLRYELSDTWRCKADLNISSDRYYLKRFPFLKSTNRILESFALLEGFHERNYTSLKTSMFQSEDNDILPKVIPIIEHNFSENLCDGTFDFDTMFLNLDFPDSRTAQKLSSNFSWSKKFMLPYGNIFNIKGLVSIGGMKVKEKEKTDYDSYGCIIPQITASWKWPLLLSKESFETIVTPIFGVILSTTKKYFDAVEDPFCEINDINILEGSRAISPYNIDNGNRLSYALRISSYLYGKNAMQFIIGRSTQLSSAFSKRLETTGLRHKNSNIVSSLDIYLNDNMIFLMKGSYSTKSKKIQRIESGLNFVYERFECDVLAFNGDQYYFNPFAKGIEKISDDKKIQKYKGITSIAGIRVSKNTKLKAGVTFNGIYNRVLKHNISFELKNECTNFEISLEKTNFTHGDLRPDTSVKITLHLKNLGI